MLNRFTSSFTHQLKLLFAAVVIFGLPLSVQAAPPKPLRALLITGGCCHDYANQQSILRDGIQARANVRVDVYWTDNSTTAPVFPIYRKLNWAEEYDVIIHDECGASIKDPAIVNRIVQVHKRLPAVHLHCAMHSFRTGGDEWFRHLGLQSTGHGPQQPIEIIFNKTEHPITQTLKDWTTGNEELYNNVKIFGAKPLAVGKQTIPGTNPRVAEAVVAWTNETQGAKSFSTTIGHNTNTVQDDRYLNLVTRGLLWACDQLNERYLVPYSGEQTTIFIDKEKHKASQGNDLGVAPKDAVLATVSASSTQNGHPAYHAIDGKASTRWCANGDSYPQAITLNFEKPQTIDSLRIQWEFDNHRYRALIEGQGLSGEWTTVHEGILSGDQTVQINPSLTLQKLRVTGTESIDGGWCSIKEILPKGKKIPSIWPAESSKEDKFVPLQGDRLEASGNTVPKIVPLTAEEENEILREVKIPEGFKATVFAAPPAVNYPVFVAASVDGTLFVSSDGNGSLGRDPSRGRIIRLRDLDQDGRADETKVFCEVDAPRGLLWDRDRLFVMHPPNLSVFFDHDDDGIADEQRTLVKNLAFGYEDRPADHTTNGLSLGVDGWLYLAGGDFGFINAVGTDGSTLTHRGGGVIRVRPDGSQLELFSTGTRNILEVAISPEMEMFARDNTNDGGGWDVRLHHFTGNEDHGYPRLYKNFNQECVQPLADYGGGSGCGAVYVAEPGFGIWGNAPFTADWGTGGLYRHQVARNGATFKETKAPEPFIRLPRPTDADIDGNSRLYCASWKGATFNWNGPNVGYIVCVAPDNFAPPVMPKFRELSNQQLVDQFQSPSHRRRLAAQRELFYRGDQQEGILLEQAIQRRPKERNLLGRLQTDASIDECINALSNQDPVVTHTAIRVLAHRGAANDCFVALDQSERDFQPLLSVLAKIHRPDVVEGLINRLATATGSKRQAILATLCRLHFLEGEWKGDSWGTRPDTRGPYYQPEAWEKTEAIRQTLEHALNSSTPEQATKLVLTMRANRIQSDDATEKMIQLAMLDPSLLSSTLEQLKRIKSVPDSANKLLKIATKADTISNADQLTLLQLLCRSDVQSDATDVLKVLARLASDSNSAATGKRIAEILKQSSKAGQHLATLSPISEQQNTSFEKSETLGIWALTLVVAANNQSSPEHLALAKAAIQQGIQSPGAQINLVQAVTWLGDRSLDTTIWGLQTSSNPQVASAAQRAVNTLKIPEPKMDNSLLIKTLDIDHAIELITKSDGDPFLGEVIFEKAKCNSCHTISQDEKQKGPYLGNIARTYKRAELTVAVLQPEKTIAQGFATNSFLTADGIVLTGFVTDEQNDRVVIRDQNGKEHMILKDDIDSRKKLTTSMMPNGILDEFTIHQAASLIEYLTSLSTK